MDKKDEPNIDLNQKRNFDLQLAEDGSFVVMDGVSALTTNVSQTVNKLKIELASDIALSAGVFAEIDEAIDYAMEGLIQDKFLSLDTDYWIEERRLYLKDVFDDPPESLTPQAELKAAVEEKKLLIEEFENDLGIADPFTNTGIIFDEIVRLICRDGEFMSRPWFLAKILQEFSKDIKYRNEFLIGILFEQLRVKMHYETQFFLGRKEKERLNEISALGTEKIKKQSLEWKSDAKKRANSILAAEPWLFGKWSELANIILDQVDCGNETDKAIYQGKNSKLKPIGSKLISTETLSKFLSGEFRPKKQ